jgi:trigger factor
MQEYADQDVDPERLRAVVENELSTEKIVDWLIEHSSVELVPEGSLTPQEEAESPLSEDTDAPEIEEEKGESTPELTQGE